MTFLIIVCFFFNDTATTEIYTLSLHDALPIYVGGVLRTAAPQRSLPGPSFSKKMRPSMIRSRLCRMHSQALRTSGAGRLPAIARSEEHTSELQSRQYLVCRLLLEKKK